MRMMSEILAKNYGDDSYEFIKSSALDMVRMHKEIIPAISNKILKSVREKVFSIVTQICQYSDAPLGTNFLAMQLIDRGQCSTGVTIISAVSLALKHTSQNSELEVDDCIDLSLHIFKEKTTIKEIRDKEVAILISTDWIITWTPIDALTTWSSILFMDTNTIEKIIDIATPILSNYICSGAMSGAQVGLVGASILVVILNNWHSEDENEDEKEHIFSIEISQYEDIKEVFCYMKELYEIGDINKWITLLST